ncbi:hypothetical protein HZY88_11070 [Aerococcaceae bacterium DSM 111176]|nr:hypothetical protein [Aerococcaceae bacterium DSM 111176]
MKLIGAYSADQYFDVSFWLVNKGYRVKDHYYKLAFTATLFGWTEIWILNLQSRYCIIKVNLVPVRVYIVDLGDEPADKDRIIYFLETGKSLPLDVNIYDTPEYLETSLCR